MAPFVASARAESRGRLHSAATGPSWHRSARRCLGPTIAITVGISRVLALKVIDGFIRRRLAPFGTVRPVVLGMVSFGIAQGAKK